MGRKKGGRNADTPAKDLEALEAKINSNKTHEAIAEKAGVTQTTVTRRIQRAIGMPQIQEFIQRSIDRNAMMLSKVDRAFNHILDSNDPMHMGHQVRVGEGIYKTFGVWKAEPEIKITNITPVIVKVDGKTFEFSPNMDVSE